MPRTAWWVLELDFSYVAWASATSLTRTMNVREVRVSRDWVTLTRILKLIAAWAWREEVEWVTW